MAGNGGQWRAMAAHVADGHWRQSRSALSKRPTICCVFWYITQSLKLNSLKLLTFYFGTVCSYWGRWNPPIFRHGADHDGSQTRHQTRGYRKCGADAGFFARARLRCRSRQKDRAIAISGRRRFTDFDASGQRSTQRDGCSRKAKSHPACRDSAHSQDGRGIRPKTD
jgi:hypothetical protein